MGPSARLHAGRRAARVVLLWLLALRAAAAQTVYPVSTAQGLVVALRSSDDPLYINVVNHLDFAAVAPVKGSGFLEVVGTAALQRTVVIMGSCTSPYMGALPGTLLAPLQHCVLNAQQRDRLFVVNGANLWLRNLVLVNSTSADSSGAFPGGGSIAAVNQANVFVNDAIIVGSSSPAAVGGGGAIAAFGNSFVNLTSVQTNLTSGAPGACVYINNSSVLYDRVVLSNIPANLQQKGSALFLDGNATAYLTNSQFVRVNASSNAYPEIRPADGTVFADFELWNGSRSLKGVANAVGLSKASALAFITAHQPAVDQFAVISSLVPTPGIPPAAVLVPTSPPPSEKKGLFDATWRVAVLASCLSLLFLSMLCICYFCYRIHRLNYERQYSFSTKMLQYDAEVDSRDVHSTAVPMPGVSPATSSRDYNSLATPSGDSDSGVKMSLFGARDASTHSPVRNNGLQVQELEMSELPTSQRRGLDRGMGSFTAVFPSLTRSSSGNANNSAMALRTVGSPVSPALAPTQSRQLWTAPLWLGGSGGGAAEAPSPPQPPPPQPPAAGAVACDTAASTPYASAELPMAPMAFPELPLSTEQAGSPSDLADLLQLAELERGAPQLPSPGRLSSLTTPSSSPQPPSPLHLLDAAPPDALDPTVVGNPLYFGDLLAHGHGVPAEQLPGLCPLPDGFGYQQAAPAAAENGLEDGAKRTAPNELDAFAAERGAEADRAGLNNAADATDGEEGHALNDRAVSALRDEKWPEADIAVPEEPRRLKYARGGVLDRASREAEPSAEAAESDDRRAAAGGKSPFSNPGGGFKRKENSASLFSRKTPGAANSKLSGRASRKKTRNRMMLNRAETPNASLFAISEEAEIRYTNGGVLYEVPAAEAGGSAKLRDSDSGSLQEGESGRLPTAGVANIDSIEEGGEGEGEGDSDSYTDSSDEGAHTYDSEDSPDSQEGAGEASASGAQRGAAAGPPGDNGFTFPQHSAVNDVFAQPAYR